MKTFRTYIETILLPVVALAAFALGFHGYTIYRPELAHTDHFISTIRLFLASFDYRWTPATAPDIPATLIAARWLALFAMLIALVKTWSVVAANHARALKLACTRRHAVVCGLGERGAYITKHLLGKNREVVVIESDAKNPNIATARADGAIVIEGDATSETLLRMAHIHTASEAHITLGDDNKVMAAAIECQRLCGGKDRKTKYGPLECNAHMQRPHDKELFKAHSLFSERTAAFHPNIIDDNLAAVRQLLVDYAGAMIAPARAPGQTPHIVIIGAGHVGQNLLLQMAHILHPTTGKPLDITLVDIHAADREKEFNSRYPFISAPPDDRAFITPAFITGNIKHCDKTLIEKILNHGNSAAAPAPNPITGVFLCISNETDSLAAATLLRQHHLDRDIPIVVCTDASEGLSDLFNEKDAAARNYRAQNIHIHNLTRSACTQHGPTGEAIDAMAKALHDDYNQRVQATAAPFPPKEEIIGWNDLPDHFKDSNRNQAANLFLNLACAGYAFGPRDPARKTAEAADPLYTRDQLQTLGRMEHRRWMIEKYLDGWRRGIRNTAYKLRPDLKPWEELDEPTKAKDIEPIASTLRHLQAAGYAVWRKSSVPSEATFRQT